MNKQAEIEALRNDPEFMAGIKRGLHARHLGHMFSWWLVKHEFEGWLGLQVYCRAIVRLKKIWWHLKTPYQKVRHRNCPQCNEF